MRACIFISKMTISKIVIALGLLTLSLPPQAFAQTSAPPETSTQPSRTEVPEDDDFSNSPFTQYGEFNEEDDEIQDTRFFQYGRFFGISLGAGYEGVTGNRGQLWQGGFPALDFKVHVWLDFNFALSIGVLTANHNYALSEGQVDINMFRLGLDLKYYFDTKNLSAAISFANPYLVVGFGNYTKSQTNLTISTEAESDSNTGVNFGAGLEFAIIPRKVFFSLEGKLHIVSFKDRYSTEFESDPGIPNLEGYFYTFIGSFLFTW